MPVCFGFSLPGSGHFHPLVPLARALARAGHEVAFATAAEMGQRVEAAGFEFHATGMGMRPQIAEARERYPEAAAIEDGRRRFEEFVPRMLAAAPARATDLIPLVAPWRPDVIVHDEAELAAPLAGVIAAVPWAVRASCCADRPAWPGCPPASSLRSPTTLASASVTT